MMPINVELRRQQTEHQRIVRERMIQFTLGNNEKQPVSKNEQMPHKQETNDAHSLGSNSLVFNNIHS